MKKGIIGVLSLLTGAAVGAAAGAVSAGKNAGEKINSRQELADKHLALYLMMNQWVKVKQEGKNLSSYFEKRGYYEVAIYGMSYAGQTLVDELKYSNIHVKYGIDKNTAIFSGIEMVATEEKLEKVDAIIVTAVSFFDQIEEELSEKISCPIISLEDILYEV